MRSRYFAMSVIPSYAAPVGSPTGTTNTAASESTVPGRSCPRAPARRQTSADPKRSRQRLRGCRIPDHREEGPVGGEAVGVEGAVAAEVFDASAGAALVQVLGEPGVG